MESTIEELRHQQLGSKTSAAGFLLAGALCRCRCVPCASRLQARDIQPDLRPHAPHVDCLLSAEKTANQSPVHREPGDLQTLNCTGLCTRGPMGRAGMMFVTGEKAWTAACTRASASAQHQSHTNMPAVSGRPRHVVCAQTISSSFV